MELARVNSSLSQQFEQTNLQSLNYSGLLGGNVEANLHWSSHNNLNRGFPTLLYLHCLILLCSLVIQFRDSTDWITLLNPVRVLRLARFVHLSLCCCDPLLFTELIKTITKFWNVIDYHEPDLSTNRTASVRVMLVIGQLTHSCLSKWTELVLHFTKLTRFFFMKTYHQCLDPFSNFVTVLITW